MNLKDFVKNALIDINTALQEASKSTSKNITLYSDKGMVEFNVAVTIGNKQGGSGEGEIKVLGLAGGKGKLEKESYDSTVSKITFKVFVDSR